MRAEHDGGKISTPGSLESRYQACCIRLMESAPLSARSAEAWTWTFSLNSREMLLYRSLRTGHEGNDEYLRSTTGAKYKKNHTSQEATSLNAVGGVGVAAPISILRFSFQKHINMEIVLHGPLPSGY